MREQESGAKQETDGSVEEVKAVPESPLERIACGRLWLHPKYNDCLAIEVIGPLEKEGGTCACPEFDLGMILYDSV